MSKLQDLQNNDIITSKQWLRLQEEIREKHYGFCINSRIYDYSSVIFRNEDGSTLLYVLVKNNFITKLKCRININMNKINPQLYIKYKFII
jgi:hypothetical protein